MIAYAFSRISLRFAAGRSVKQGGGSLFLVKKKLAERTEFNLKIWEEMTRGQPQYENEAEWLMNWSGRRLTMVGLLNCVRHNSSSKLSTADPLILDVVRRN